MSAAACGVLVASLVLSVIPSTHTIDVPAARDATLIESVAGELANGSGPVMFAGRTNQQEGATRRALLHFDIAAPLPPRAEVCSVTLTLHALPANPGPHRFALHRVTRPWSEGPAASDGGGGAPSQQHDVTWLHSSYPDCRWPRPGGMIRSRPSASTVVGQAGAYTWTGSPAMVRDVRHWLRSPRANHGWLLQGDETRTQSVKSFGSRENPDAQLLPVLTVTYRIR
jgi:hypothetical protein